MPRRISPKGAARPCADPQATDPPPPESQPIEPRSKKITVTSSVPSNARVHHYHGPSLGCWRDTDLFLMDEEGGDR